MKATIHDVFSVQMSVAEQHGGPGCELVDVALVLPIEICPTFVDRLQDRQYSAGGGVGHWSAQHCGDMEPVAVNFFVKVRISPGFSACKKGCSKNGAEISGEAAMSRSKVLKNQSTECNVQIEKNSS